MKNGKYKAELWEKHFAQVNKRQLLQGFSCELVVYTAVKQNNLSTSSLTIPLWEGHPTILKKVLCPQWKSKAT